MGATGRRCRRACISDRLPRRLVSHLVLRLLGAGRVGIAVLVLQSFLFFALRWGGFPGVFRNRC